MIEAPWTDEQVEKLNEYQTKGFFHPFTCGSGNRGDEKHRKIAEERGDGDLGLLIATNAGWVCPACSYTQNWAHGMMFRGAVKPWFPWDTVDE